MLLSVRPARPEDDAEIGELLVRAFVDGYAKKLPQVVVTERRKQELRDVAGKRAEACVWVVTRAGAIVGTVALWPPGRPRSEAFLEGAWDLRHLAVDASVKGTGASGLLLDTAEAHARAAGAPSVCLHVRQGAVGVARLYQGRGYVRHPEGDLDRRPEVFLEAYFLPLR
jgi:predicted N-acetyltransferase YhbS